MSAEKHKEPDAVPFRFLSQKEFAALSTDDRVKYLERALEAIKSGHPLGDLTDKNPQ